MAARRRHEPAPTSSNGPLVLIVGFVLLVIGAVAVMSSGGDGATAADDPRPEPAARGSGSNPFGDVQLELPSATRKMKDLAPPGLMERPVFTAARAKAEEAIALVDEAFAAREGGDTERFRELGLRAKRLLEEATEATTDWWLELDQQYPGDRQVEKISRVRKRWGKALKRVRVIK